MSTQTEALKLALELFEQFGRDSRLKYEHQAIYKTIVAIKEVLAQPEQKPVAWWVPKAEQFCLPSSDGTRPFAKAWEPLYTTPPQRTWVGLTDEEIRKASLEAGMQEHYMDFHSGFIRFSQVIENKLKDKNTNA